MRLTTYLPFVGLLDSALHHFDADFDYHTVVDDVAVADTVAVAVAVADTVAVDIVVVDIVDCGIDVGSVVCQMTTDEGKMISYPKNGLFYS